MTEQFKTELQDLASRLAEGDNDEKAFAVALFAGMGAERFGNMREFSDICADFSRRTLQAIERERAALKVQGN